MFSDYIDTITPLIQYDEEVGKAMEAELKRQKRNLELIASENIVSPAVMAAMGSVLTNKYAEGYPGKRYYGGCECVDVVETIAIERAKKLFGAEAATFSLTRARRQTWRLIPQFLNPVMLLWA